MKGLSAFRKSGRRPEPRSSPPRKPPGRRESGPIFPHRRAAARPSGSPAELLSPTSADSARRRIEKPPVASGPRKSSFLRSRARARRRRVLTASSLRFKQSAVSAVLTSSTPRIRTPSDTCPAGCRSPPPESSSHRRPTPIFPDRRGCAHSRWRSPTRRFGIEGCGLCPAPAGEGLVNRDPGQPRRVGRNAIPGSGVHPRRNSLRPANCGERTWQRQVLTTLARLPPRNVRMCVRALRTRADHARMVRVLHHSIQRK